MFQVGTTSRSPGRRVDPSSESGPRNHATPGELLTELDGLEELEDVVVIAASNRPDLIDDALLRPGRIERHIEVVAPDEDARREILDIHTRDRPLADDVDIDVLATETDGYVGADLASLCREPATAAVREHVRATAAGEASAVDEIVLTRDHFERALEEVKPSSESDSNDVDQLAGSIPTGD